MGYKNLRESMKLLFDDSGIFFGLPSGKDRWYVGKKESIEGNIMLSGTTGSSKTTGLVEPTLITNRSPSVVFDPKGDVSSWYDELYSTEELPFRIRKPLIFSPKNGRVKYDPYQKMREKGANILQCAKEIAFAIIEKPVDVREPYWLDAGRDVLAAIIMYGFSLGLDFSETMLYANANQLAEILMEIEKSDCLEAKMLISDIKDTKAKNQEDDKHFRSIASTVKRSINVFATDSDLNQIFYIEEGDEVLSWKCLEAEDAPSVFLNFDQSLLGQWKGAVRMMLSQLISYLKERPEKYSPEGCKMNYILILLDEFPVLGKMDMITDAVTILRSKKVTFFLVIQSMAQLEGTYGRNTSRVLLDNCQYKVILNVTERESQEYFSKLIGSVHSASNQVAVSFDNGLEHNGCGLQFSETITPLIEPELFALNKEVWILTPKGFIAAKKTHSTELLDLMRISDIRWFMMQ